MGSKQVVLYGRHPSGREYAWVGDAEPLTHGWSEVPVVAAKALSEFRSEAIALCGQVGAGPSPSMRPGSLAACGGSVSELMTDLFGLFSESSSRDRLAVAAEFLGSAVRGMRNNTLAATVSCLVLSGYSDRQIVMALGEDWAGIMRGEDPGLRQLRATPPGIRRRMVLRGAAVRPVEDLDAELDGGWGVFD